MKSFLWMWQVKVVRNIAKQALPIKQCFATWPNGQTLFVKQISNFWRTMFHRLATALTHHILIPFLHDQRSSSAPVHSSSVQHHCSIVFGSTPPQQIFSTASFSSPLAFWPLNSTWTSPRFNSCSPSLLFSSTPRQQHPSFTRLALSQLLLRFTTYIMLDILLFSILFFFLVCNQSFKTHVSFPE